MKFAGGIAAVCAAALVLPTWAHAQERLVLGDAKAAVAGKPLPHTLRSRPVLLDLPALAKASVAADRRLEVAFFDDAK